MTSMNAAQNHLTSGTFVWASIVPLVAENCRLHPRHLYSRLPPTRTYSVQPQASQAKPRG